MTEAEIEAAIAEWHDAPEGSPIAAKELHEQPAVERHYRGGY